MSDEPTSKLLAELARAIEAVKPKTGRLQRIEMSRSMFDQLHRAMFANDPDGIPEWARSTIGLRLWSTPLHVVDDLAGDEIRVTATVTPSLHTMPTGRRDGMTARPTKETELRSGCCADWPKPCGYHEGYLDGFEHGVEIGKADRADLDREIDTEARCLGCGCWVDLDNLDAEGFGPDCRVQDDGSMCG